MRGDSQNIKSFFWSTGGKILTSSRHVAQRTAKTGLQWDQNVRRVKDSRIFCESYVTIQAFEAGWLVVREEIKGKHPCGVKEGRKGLRGTEVNRKMIPAKWHLRRTSLKATAEAASLLYCQNLPLTALVGVAGATFWACTEHEGNPSDSCPSECSSPHRKATVSANYCRRCIWVLLDSRFFANSFCINLWLVPFSSHLPLSPGIKLRNSLATKEDLPGSFCFSSPPPATVFSPVSHNVKMLMSNSWFHSYGDMFSKHWLK